MSGCSPTDRYANCPMKKSGSLDACHWPGGCLHGRETHEQACERVDSALASDREKMASSYRQDPGRGRARGSLTREEEAALATFFARPEWARVRPLLEQTAPGAADKIDAVVRRVRVELWRDFSKR